MREKLDSRGLAALLSSLISQFIVLLTLLFPSSSSTPLSLTTTTTTTTTAAASSAATFHSILFALLHHLLSASEIASTHSLLSFSRKRKRTHFRDADARDDDDVDEPGLVHLGRVDSAIPRTPDPFKTIFRMNPSTFEWLCGLLEPLLECRDPVDSPLNLPAESRLGIGLFRLATGADHLEISRRFQVSELVARFCVKQLCRVLCTNYRFWVGFPSQNELDSVSTQFETLTKLPNCCGILHCMRFMVRRNIRPGSIPKDKPQEESIAAQIVVDSSSRILSIAAGFHSDKDDLKVLKGSTLYQDIKKGAIMNSHPKHINNVAIPQYLLGVGDYPLLSWLIVPFDDPKAGSHEENFNSSHSAMRIRMRKAVVSLKNWGILSRPIEAEFKAAVAYIGACSILHNMLLMREDYSAFCDEFDGSAPFDQSSRFCRNNVNEEEDVVEKTASEIRNALATKARVAL